MEIQEALRIMRALADGVNPETGEAMTTDSVYQYAPAVRALHQAVSALEFMEERLRNKRSLPSKAGKSWSRAEDQQVCEELRRGIDFHQIAKTHNRSVGSIIARLVKLGKIGPDTPLDLFGPKVA
jgi:DNA-binding NarL/FixJ family response regulator